MQAQNMMWVPAIATSFAAVVNIPVNLLLIKYYAFPGAAAAFSVTRVLLFLFLIGESLKPLHRRPVHRSWLEASTICKASHCWIAAAWLCSTVPHHAFGLCMAWIP